MDTKHPSSFAMAMLPGQSRKSPPDSSLPAPVLRTPREVALAFFRHLNDSVQGLTLAPDAMALLRNAERVEATQTGAEQVLVECYLTDQPRPLGIVQMQVQDQAVSALILYWPK